MDMSEFLEVFFEECSEGLDVMESGLLAIDVAAVDVEEINTIFRAAHSIKGGSATFDLTDIASFTHVMETLLDQMRSGERQADTSDIDLLLESVDCLREMIDATKAEEAHDDARVADLKKRLEVALSRNNAAEADSNSAKEETDEPDDSAAATGWIIEFFPKPELLKNGQEPYRLFDELRKLGELEITSQLHNLPTLQELEPTSLYLGWRLELKGNIEEDKIHEVFSWVNDLCEYSTTPLAGAEPAEPKAEEPAPEQPAAETQSPETSATKPVEPETPEKADIKVNKQEKAPQSKPDTPPAEAVKAVSKPAPKPAPQKPASKKSGSESGSIRVSIEKIDSLINLVGELIITQSMLSRFADDFDMSQIEDLRDGLGLLTRNSRELQETAMQIRMLPISSSFNRFPRLVRDLSAKLGKKVELKISGESTELDKTVLEKIADPLVHLVRNSLDHGLETPDVRKAAGKSETGIVHLDAFHEGGNIVIEVTDDGAGLNKDRILAKAIEKGVVAADEKLSDDEINNLIFAPGFSTADTVSDISGRGVGMDVVRRNIIELGGQIYIQSEQGKGSTLSIRLPLTLAIIEGQNVKVGDEKYVIPMLSIDESLQVNPELISKYKGKVDLYKLREEYIPILKLHEIFGIETDVTDFRDGLLVVVEAERRRVGLFVDELLGQQQVVIKSLEKNYRKVDCLSGATILGDGTVALIMDIGSLIRKHLSSQGKHNVPARDAA